MKNNKLIAEFMNTKHIGVQCATEFVSYNNSWDWLMLVVEKISRIDWYGGSTDVLSTWTTRPFSFEIASAYSQVVIECNVGLTKNFFNFHNKSKSMITNTYVAVIEFIKWYNLNK